MIGSRASLARGPKSKSGKSQSGKNTETMTFILFAKKCAPLYDNVIVCCRNTFRIGVHGLPV